TDACTPAFAVPVSTGLALGASGDWKVAKTRGQECPRYVAQAFQPAGSGDFPVTRSCKPRFAQSRTVSSYTPFQQWCLAGVTLAREHCLISGEDTHERAGRRM